jgi:hypothetical protein
VDRYPSTVSADTERVAAADFNTGPLWLYFTHINQKTGTWESGLARAPRGCLWTLEMAARAGGEPIGGLARGESRGGAHMGGGLWTPDSPGLEGIFARIVVVWGRESYRSSLSAPETLRCLSRTPEVGNPPG